MPGVNKSMPSAPSAANPASDALTNLTRAAAAAFTAVQEQAQTDIAHARAERDDALKALHEAQLDAKDLEAREEGWRAALEKSDLTIKHQTETIAQLRSEVDQWKTQLTRLEESSRQEIEDWKEQYRRAEHERARLSARIEELIAGQLAWNAAAHAYNTPYTPRPVAYAEYPDPTTSTSAARWTPRVHPRADGTPHTHSRAYPTDDEAPQPPPRKAKPANSRTVAQGDRVPASGSRGGSPVRQPAGRRKDLVSVEVPRASGSRPAPRTPAARPSPAQREPELRAEPRQQVIRRVTAIVDVKEEDQEDGFNDQESANSGSVYDPDEDIPPIPPSGRRRRASNASTRRKQVVPEWDEDEPPPDSGDEGEQYGEPPDDEDDELLLGPKSTKPAPGTVKRPRASGKPSGGAKNLKRKIDADVVAPSGRIGPAKTAKIR